MQQNCRRGDPDEKADQTVIPVLPALLWTAHCQERETGPRQGDSMFGSAALTDVTLLPQELPPNRNPHGPTYPNPIARIGPNGLDPI